MKVWIVIMGEEISGRTTFDKVLAVCTNGKFAHELSGVAMSMLDEDSTENVVVSGPHEVVE